MLRNLLKFAAGAAIGFVLWLYATPAYNTALAAGARVLHADRRFAGARIIAVGRRVEVLPVNAPSRALPADQLTYNVILLAGLFATNRDFFRDRNMRRLALSIAILVVTHVAALVVTIEADYAQRLAEWSEAHYGRVETFFWSEAEYFYRLVGMFGIAFACWWLSSSESAPGAGRARGSRKRPGPR